MFEEALQLARSYGQRYSADINMDLLAELEERLRQLEFIYGRVCELTTQSEAVFRDPQIAASTHFAALPAPRPAVSTIPLPLPMAQGFQNAFDKMGALQVEIRTLTEAFYYFAWRTHTIVSSLPHLHSFKCVGVRDVRNHLIEHPEGRNSRVFVQNSSWRSRWTHIKGWTTR